MFTCCNEWGELVCCAVVQSTVSWDTRVAKVKAVLEGLIVAKEQGCSRVFLESDSLQVIQALQKGGGGSSDFQC